LLPYSQRYLFNAIRDANHNTNPITNSNRNSKGYPNPTNPTNTTNPINQSINQSIYLANCPIKININKTI